MQQICRVIDKAYQHSTNWMMLGMLYQGIIAAQASCCVYLAASGLGRLNLSSCRPTEKGKLWKCSWVLCAQSRLRVVTLTHSRQYRPSLKFATTHTSSCGCLLKFCRMQSWTLSICDCMFSMAVHALPCNAGCAVHKCYWQISCRVANMSVVHPMLTKEKHYTGSRLLGKWRGHKL